MARGVLEELFKRRQETLEAELNPESSTSSHTTAKGDHTELRWHNMLRSFLPDRYSVARGEIVDSQGGRSDQIDLIVYDRFYTPPLADEEYKVLPVEAVYAVFEIKPTLDKSAFDYAVSKSGSVRTLAPENTQLGVPGLPDPLRNTSARILTGLLTHRTKVGNLDTMLGEWSAGSDETGRLDLICSLTDGSFELTYEGDTLVEMSNSDTSLVWFCTRLFERIRESGTAAPVNLRKYLDAK